MVSLLDQPLGHLPVAAQQCQPSVLDVHLTLDLEDAESGRELSGPLEILLEGGDLTRAEVQGATMEPGDHLGRQRKTSTSQAQ